MVDTFCKSHSLSAKKKQTLLDVAFCQIQKYNQQQSQQSQLSEHSNNLVASAQKKAADVEEHDGGTDETLAHQATANIKRHNRVDSLQN